MRKLLVLLVTVCLFVNTGNAAFTELAESKTAAKENYGAFKNAETKAAAEFFTKLSRKDYEQLTGRHLSVVERLSFKITQKRLKKELKREAETDGFNLGGFVLGLLLGLIGILLAYIFSKDSNLRKWAWIGWGAWLVILLIIVLAS